MRGENDGADEEGAVAGPGGLGKRQARATMRADSRRSGGRAKRTRTHLSREGKLGGSRKFWSNGNYFSSKIGARLAAGRMERGVLGLIRERENSRL